MVPLLVKYFNWCSFRCRNFGHFDHNVQWAEEENLILSTHRDPFFVFHSFRIRRAHGKHIQLQSWCSCYRNFAIFSFRSFYHML